MPNHLTKIDYSNTQHGVYRINEKVYKDKHLNDWYETECMICKTTLNMSHNYIYKSSLNTCRCKRILDKRKSLNLVR